jgi:hypothetical protein
MTFMGVLAWLLFSRPWKRFSRHSGSPDRRLPNLSELAIYVAHAGICAGSGATPVAGAKFRANTS